MDLSAQAVAYNPHIKRVLKSFQSAAERSLNGPSQYAGNWAGEPTKMSPEELLEYRKAILDTLGKGPGAATTPTTLDRAPAGSPQDGLGAQAALSFQSAAAFPTKPMPFMLPMDNSKCEKGDTVLEGETISCFTVGGEKRLCLPQILNTVLRDFTLSQINAVCDDLHIFCSRCNPEQLESLKISGVLPLSAPSCGLITKTDAERLCNALLHGGKPERMADPPTPNSFKVYHECFGKCKGIFTPELYKNPDSKCIECYDCHGMYSPQKFVCHSHKSLENRTCHWGFDSANWRAYLLLAKDQENDNRLQLALDHMKARFDFLKSYKRKETCDTDKDPSKRARFEDSSKYEALLSSSAAAAAATRSWLEASGLRPQLSAFRPWSPSLLTALKGRDGVPRVLPAYLQTGPPVLLNPESVVPFSDKQRYDRHFAPNVSLAPQTPQTKCEEEEEEEMSPVKQEVSPAKVSQDAVWTDTESSTASTPQEEAAPSLPSPKAMTREHECQLEMLRTAMEGKVGQSREAQERFVEEFVHLQARQEERFRALTNAHRAILRELDELRLTQEDKLREVRESRSRLRRDLERTQKERDRESHEHTEQRKRLNREIDALRSTNTSALERVREEYQSQLERAQSRVAQQEQLHQQMTLEMAKLRDTLKQLGKDVPETKFEMPANGICNGKEVKQEEMSGAEEEEGQEDIEVDGVEEEEGCTQASMEDAQK